MRSPFKFLDAYQKDDRDIYFGRDGETDELYDRVYETNLILLYGASGTGKTSLINCGLANRYESTDWYPIFIRRKDNMLRSLDDELQRHAVMKPAQGTTVGNRIRSLYLDYFKPIYLIFDQFEEIFISGKKEEQDAFFGVIWEILKEGLQCKIVLSMREEYIAHLSDFERVVPSLFENRFRIEKMSTRHVEEVIRGTADAFKIPLSEPEVLVSKMVQNLRDRKEGIELANLQVYLDRMYRLAYERSGGDTAKLLFDPGLVDTAGELDDVLAAFLDEQIDTLEAELAEKKLGKPGTPMSVLFALVTDNGTKQSIGTPELQQFLAERRSLDAQAVDYCLKRFKEMRILRELEV